MLHSFIASSFSFTFRQLSRFPEVRKLIGFIYSKNNNYLLMYKAYEDNKTLVLAKTHTFCTIVPHKRNRKFTWFYNKSLYKQRNVIKRYFIRLKRFRKVFTRHNKLDPIFIFTIYLAFIFDLLFVRTLPSRIKNIFLY